ncbi:MAG: hypothetical protein HPY69_08910 [Armatimonadetes bacterium]|nr:hypothetical protein [Armatimonadota bacterium]
MRALLTLVPATVAVLGVAWAADRLVISDFRTMSGIVAAPWPDEDGAAPTSTITIATADGGPQHPSALRLDYEFPSARSTQVRLDLPVPYCGNYAQLSLAVRGDGSGNVLEVWTSEQARGWHGVGSLPLDFTEWREVTMRLDDSFTMLATTLRVIVRRAGALGAHTVTLDDITLTGPVDKPLPADFAYGPRVPGPPPFQRECGFRLEKQRAGDKTVALLDGEPLACVLDALPTPEYLELARRAGVNSFALDLYWRDLEPEPGFDRWQPLQEFVDWLGQAGFGVVMLVNIHQPRWLLAQCPEEPVVGDAIYPGNPLVRSEFTRFLRRFLPTFRDARNLVVVGVSTGGEAAASYPEVPGEPSRWRESPTLLADFRAFLRQRYATDAAWREAWEVPEPEASIAAAVPPQPLGDGLGPWKDFRPSWHDWREFTDGFWVPQTAWQAKLVKELLPGRLVMVRFGWPVFQCENVFLARQAPDVDLLQCMDAVPTWEAATPWFIVSRAALYHGALRGTDKVVFTEADIGHNRGRPTDADMTTYLPPLAPFIGALWYYRGLHESFVSGLGEALGSLRSAIPQATSPRVGVFYGQKYANWTQHHANYANEAMLAGAARVLGEAGIPWTVLSEYTLDSLRDLEVLIVADNPVLPEEAATAITAFAAAGGSVAVEETPRTDLRGQRSSFAVPAAAHRLPGGFLASVQPRGEGLQFTARQAVTRNRLVEWIESRLAQ